MPAGDQLRYPLEREADVALRDGSTAHVRPVRAADGPGMLAFLKALSEQSRYFRFFSGAANLERVAEWSVDVDYRKRYGIIATVGGDDRIVAHAAYTWIGDRRAEVALEVAD